MYKTAALVLVLGLAGVLEALIPRSEGSWGVNLSAPEMIQSFGYPVEVHHVATRDGYILELHRIPYGLSLGGYRDRPVALLYHGLYGSSADWILNKADQALAYIMADEGYDVWLANARGNRYSRAHQTLDPRDIDFWDFSWDEIAEFDLPATIDYVLPTTGARDLFYVGFSMGTTVFFAMLSEHPEYNDKGNARGLVSTVAPFINQLDKKLTSMGVGEIFPNNELTRSWAMKLCDRNSLLAVFCRKILATIGGPNPDELNRDLLATITAHTPAGTSVHSVTHFGQLITSDGFYKFDHGPHGNLRRYGQRQPPSYDLSQVRIPVAIFAGENDYLADPRDVELTERELPNVVQTTTLASFSHMDFTWAVHAYDYVYRHVLDFFWNYRN
ncbi:lipase 3-like isoform X2 [Penaeus monodon]|uniref:lipase 3-like isoform X2 n=1 Tax=Penaeus monodon TaxID=6687 RepID=UPI0018A78398|nr:lipase 3-like isoform X2 [Penaeus monodon]